jgi:parallel beta-helix repeat protein
MNSKKIAVIWMSLIILSSLIVIILEITPSVKASTTWFVDASNPGPGDGSPGNPFKIIQAGVDNATPGDTVFVYAGTYYEDVYINKTINLTGISRDNTTINATDIGILAENADYINISGFTVENGSIIGIKTEYANMSIITKNKLQSNNEAIFLFHSNNTLIYNNTIINNNNGIYLTESNFNNISKNMVVNNTGNGIELRSYSDNNTVVNNTVTNNKHGIIIRLWSDNNQIIDNIINSNMNIGIYVVISNNNLFLNNTCINNNIGAYLNYYFTDSNKLVNCTIQDSVEYDINMTFESKGLVLNTIFNKSKTHYFSTTSSLIVQWYIHVYVLDYLGNPVANTNIEIKDNKNSSYQEIYTTDVNGYLRWLPVTVCTTHYERKQNRYNRPLQWHIIRFRTWLELNLITQNPIKHQSTNRPSIHRRPI